SCTARLHSRRASAARSRRRAGSEPDMRRLLPYPVIAVGLLALWLLLNQTLSLGHVLIGAVVAIAGGMILSVLEPPKAHLRRPGAMLRLAGLVLADIIRSNIAVGRIILGFGR